MSRVEQHSRKAVKRKRRAAFKAREIRERWSSGAGGSSGGEEPRAQSPPFRQLWRDAEGLQVETWRGESTGQQAASAPPACGRTHDHLEKDFLRKKLTDFLHRKGLVPKKAGRPLKRPKRCTVTTQAVSPHLATKERAQGRAGQRQNRARKAPQKTSPCDAHTAVAPSKATVSPGKTTQPQATVTVQQQSSQLSLEGKSGGCPLSRNSTGEASSSGQGLHFDFGDRPGSTERGTQTPTRPSSRKKISVPDAADSIHTPAQPVQRPVPQQQGEEEEEEEWRTLRDERFWSPSTSSSRRRHDPISSWLSVSSHRPHEPSLPLEGGSLLPDYPLQPYNLLSSLPTSASTSAASLYLPLRQHHAPGAERCVSVDTGLQLQGGHEPGARPRQVVDPRPPHQQLIDVMQDNLLRSSASSPSTHSLPVPPREHYRYFSPSGAH